MDFNDIAENPEQVRKTLEYKWELGHEELMLEVDAYRYENRLYIGLTHMVDGQEESFADLTINLPYEEAAVNEAYIDDFASKSKLDFIKRHKLGKVLSEMGHSGMASYYKVSFNLERLAEFDKAGVDMFRGLNRIPKPELAKNKNHHKER